MRKAIAVLLAGACAIAISRRSLSAQPPDLDRARQLYAAAEAAMADARHADARRDYLAAYAVSKDPALLYKLGGAFLEAKLCRQAVGFFAAYLRRGQPSPEFLVLTRERIRACGMDPEALPAGIEEEAMSTISGPADAGSAAEPGSGSGSEIVEPSSGAIGADAILDPGAGSGAVSTSAGAPVLAKHRGAWLLVGGAIAAATAGAVLAYSANAAEHDLEDLYVGLGGEPPTFNATTRARFDDVVAEGRRYQTLSWVSCAVAGVLGGLATWRFLVDERPVQITPAASPTGAGVSAGFRF